MIDTHKIAITTPLNSSVLGAVNPKIVFSASIIISPPTRRMIKETIIEDIYSILACPKGCPLSAGLDDILKLISVTIDAPASDRLFSESAIIALEEEISPAISLIIDSKRFKDIPTTPDNDPHFFLTIGSSGLS